MNVNSFVEEMLDEVKNLKDLAKDEIPIVAKEYIEAKKVKTKITLSLGLLSILLSVSLAIFSYLAKNDSAEQILAVTVSLVSFLFGVVLTAEATTSLIDLIYQPRRMAIKAITSLTKED